MSTRGLLPPAGLDRCGASTSRASLAAVIWFAVGLGWGAGMLSWRVARNSSQSGGSLSHTRPACNPHPPRPLGDAPSSGPAPVDGCHPLRDGFGQQSSNYRVPARAAATGDGYGRGVRHAHKEAEAGG